MREVEMKQKAQAELEDLFSGIEPQMEGVKFDQGKLRMDLLPPEVENAIARILTDGAKKYTVEVFNEWDALLYAQCAAEIQVVTPRGNVVSVTRNTSETQIPIMQNASVKIEDPGLQKTQRKLESWASVDGLIRSLVSETGERSGLQQSRSADSQKISIQNCAPGVAQSVEPKNTCTLIIVTKQGRLEVSFAPGVTMDSGFWMTVWKALKEHYGISRPQNKTGERNWERGMAWSRPYAALRRHLIAWWSGQDTDPESGHSHLWHVLTNAAFLVAYEQRGIGEDDRP